jgi:hypothetical protein
MMSRTWKLAVIGFIAAVTFLTQIADSEAGWRRCRRAYRHGGCCATACNYQQDGFHEENMEGNTPPPAPTADMSIPPQPNA